ncbi:hypothetical protein [Streptomyces californicus]|uniref:hypothetical protein n=1 Tax=Streptomyces californicus TaxID=67351 RepID=UPI0037102A35
MDFNRRRKSVPTAMELLRRHGGRLTEADVTGLSAQSIADAARAAGVKIPGGDETRTMVRAELRKLAGLPPQPGDNTPAESVPARPTATTVPARPTATTVPARPTATTVPATALTAAHLDSLLALGLPVVLVPTRAAA